MKSFIAISLIILGAAFYELSGGSDFDPIEARAAAIEMRTDQNIARAVLSDFVAGTPTQPASSDPGSPPSSEDTSATRANLNLVSFAAASKATARPTANEVKPAAAPAPVSGATATPLAEMARTIAEGAEQPSVVAWENTDPPASEDVPDGRAVFEGTSLVSTSLPQDNGPVIRTVGGTLVNLRSGPSTSFEVIDQLAQGTQVEVISTDGAGWVELRPLSGGPTGWMAEFLLVGG